MTDEPPTIAEIAARTAAFASKLALDKFASIPLKPNPAWRWWKFWERRMVWDAPTFPEGATVTFRRPAAFSDAFAERAAQVEAGQRDNRIRAEIAKLERTPMRDIAELVIRLTDRVTVLEAELAKYGEAP